MPRPSSTGIKYLIKQGDRYIIKRHINGEYVHFASFTDLEEAKEYMKYIKAHNWSLECKKKTYRGRGGPMYCISHPYPDVYQVIKSIDGKHRQYGCFNNLRDAQRHRDYCVEHNWSEDCVLRRKEKYGLPKYVSWNKKTKQYNVLKYRDRRVIFSNTYKRLEDALRERDLLIKYNWDEEKLIEHDETFGSIWK